MTTNAAFAKTPETDLLDSTSCAIMRALLYFDIFSYPLTEDEILRFLPQTVSNKTNLKSALNLLVIEGYVKQSGTFYFLGNDASVIERRKDGNKAANLMKNKAIFYSKLISCFPFVRCVCISGSLSKGYIDAKSDIDYFIITKPGRLWIARSLLIGFKKVFLLNSHKYFCVNYFIDTTHLEIPDKNIFTATELLSLIPMSNQKLYNSFLDSNKWSTQFLPNYKSDTTPISNNTTPILTTIFELLFAGKFGNWLDEKLMHATVQRWKSKFHGFSVEEMEQAMRSRKYVSKHHPQNFQNKVLTALEKQIATFESLHQVKL